MAWKPGDPWYETDHLIQGFFWTWTNEKAHSGIDVSMPQGYPLSSPVQGEVLHAGYHPWGGQVDIVYSDGGQEYTVSLLHMSKIDPQVKAGYKVQPGSSLGLSGGDNLAPYSRGHHLHWELWIGRGAPYIDYSPWRAKTDHHPIDPTPMWMNLRKNGLPAGSGVGGAGGGPNAFFPCPPPDWWPSWLAYPRDCSQSTGGAKEEFGPQRAHDVLQELPGFLGIASAIDDVETVTPFQPPQGLLNTPQVPGYVAGWVIGNTMAIAVRMAVIVMGLIMILILILAAVRKPVAEALDVASMAMTGQPAPIAGGMRNAGPLPGAQAQPPGQQSAQGAQPTMQAAPANAPARVASANAPTVPMRVP